VNDENVDSACKRRKPNNYTENKPVNECARSSLNTSSTNCVYTNSDVEDLLSTIKEIPKFEGGSWRKSLHSHVSSPGFARLAKFVASERMSKTIYPPTEDVFTALNITPLHKVRVVIVGQDPYHGPNQGHGLAFSVKKGIAVPPSLNNIYKELMDDDDVPFSPLRPMHGNLERWARQGVLLLNSVLTVRRGEANSHANKGWEIFTDEVIRVLNTEHRGLVFLLWGKPASAKAEKIIDKRRHTVICTSHPSPLGASKTKSPFLGSRCFSRANNALCKAGLDAIDWNVDGDL